VGWLAQRPGGLVRGWHRSGEVGGFQWFFHRRFTSCLQTCGSLGSPSPQSFGTEESHEGFFVRLLELAAIEVTSRHRGDRRYITSTLVLHLVFI
jgi:hypothetical protein